jgi:hypothetical protein
MPQTYTTYQLTDVQRALALRLYDPAYQFWPLAELALYIVEALQTWNALTNFWRGDFVFPGVASQTWYDLTLQTNSLRPMTATVPSVYPIINAHLLEPLSGPVSQQFSTAEYANALLYRVNEMLGETGATLTRSLIPAANGRIIFADGTFDVVRIAYIPAPAPGTGIGYGTGAYGVGPYDAVTTQALQNVTLWRDDTWAEMAFATSYLQSPAGFPSVYWMSTEPPIAFEVDVRPGYGGQYETLTTNQAPTPAPGGIQTIPLPNDWVHVAKWGALAYLLSTESNAKDVSRAKYCAERFKVGKRLLEKSAALLALRIGNVPLQIDSVEAGDEYDARWQSQAPGTPRNAWQAGLNLVGLAPAPIAPTTSLTATVVQNAPVPVNATDWIQVSEDVLNVILDYAQHLAAFKQGGAEFAATMPLLETFLREATVYNSKLTEMGEYTEFLTGISQMNESRNPRLDPEVLA